MMVHALLLSGKPNPKSTVAHRQKIKLNQTDRVSGRSPDHDVFERTPLVGGTPKTHLVLLVLLRCRIGLTPQSDVTQLLSSVSELSWDKMCFWYTAITMSVPKRFVRAAPRHPANTSRSQIKICQRSPFSSNSKSWGPAGLPVGSDLVIDDIAD